MLRTGDHAGQAARSGSSPQATRRGGAVGEHTAGAAEVDSYVERPGGDGMPHLIRHGSADVGRSREVLRRKRLLTVVLVVGLPAAYLWYRILSGDPLNLFNLPSVDPL